MTFNSFLLTFDTQPSMTFDTLALDSLRGLRLDEKSRAELSMQIFNNYCKSLRKCLRITYGQWSIPILMMHKLPEKYV